jgi:type VI secretion system protein ImpE
MNAVELIRAGKLSEARASLVQDVKGAPADLESRILLFKVLSFLGEWDKARLHLEAIEAQTPTKGGDLSQYKNLIVAERQREEVRLHKRAPEFLSEPPQYLSEFLAARAELASGKGDLFASLLPRLEQQFISVSGTVQGVPFTGLADLDATLLPFLEVFIHDRYLWFPFTSLRELSVFPPASLLDLLWSRARIVTWDGLTTECILPVLYPGSCSNADDQVRLGRMTEWETVGGYCRGVGHHLLMVGEEEKGLLELGEVLFNFAGAEEDNG